MALTDNLKAFWKADESSGNLVDSSGNGYTLTNVNTVGFSAGKIGNCADTGSSNTNKWCYINNNLGLTLDGTGTFSVSYWVNMYSWYSGDDLNMSLMLSRTNQRRIWTGVANNGSRLAVLVIGSSARRYDKNYSFSLNTWYHIVITFDGTEIRYYVNNEYLGKNTIGSLGTATHFDYVSLFREYNDGKYASQKMDAIGIWDKVLSTDEISTLYNSGAGLQYPFIAGSSNFFQLF